MGYGILCIRIPGQCFFKSFRHSDPPAHTHTSYPTPHTSYSNFLSCVLENKTMAEKIKQVQTKQVQPTYNLFGKENYVWIIAGIIVIAIGLFLMAGGNSNDPNVFKENEVYSKTRITVAPILILLGLGIEVFAIFRKPKK